ncbi:hypothetical protein MMC14_009573, partial [Varicellaria rhodocarpa]|nr:hypothetical protein [Varicellaria rhodocarpa]
RHRDNDDEISGRKEKRTGTVFTHHPTKCLPIFHCGTSTATAVQDAITASTKDIGSRQSFDRNVSLPPPATLPYHHLGPLEVLEEAILISNNRTARRIATLKKASLQKGNVATISYLAPPKNLAILNLEETSRIIDGAIQSSLARITSNNAS